MTHLTTTEAAIVAAAQASEATTELLRFAREGEHSVRSAFGETDVIGKLTEALSLALDIDAPDPANTHLDDDEMALLADLKASCARFIEGWVG